MRKIALPLVVLLLATPVLAAVRIIIENDNCGALIKYATDGEKVRAFALDVTVDGDATIDAISQFHKGESTAASPGYGIFPANFGQYITVNADTGEVESWDVAEYTPLADPCDPGALGGLGTDGVTLEMGALYYPTDDTSPNAPGDSGTLCKLEVSGSCNMSAVVNAIRGGVVLTDATSVDPDLSGATNVEVCSAACPFDTQAECDEWAAVGSPECWTYLRQCHGDADNASQGKKKYWVSTNDLDILIAAWNKPFGDLVGNQICADFDHSSQGKKKYRVSTNDLDILVANWNQDNAPAPDCFD
jgi:hypothetical protein